MMIRWGWDRSDEWEAMSGLNPEFKLAELELPEKALARIERVREKMIPESEELQSHRDRAEQGGIVEIDEDELTINFLDRTEMYHLEHTLTGTMVGAMGSHPFRPKEYRLLWLIDGRTIETVRFGRTESYIIYADGMEVGSIDIKNTQKSVFLFRIPIEWVIKIGDTDIIQMCLVRIPKLQIHLEFLNKHPSQASSQELFLPLYQPPIIPPKTSPDTMWFLPRNENDQPLTDTLEDRLALMAFALLMRDAFCGVDR